MMDKRVILAVLTTVILLSVIFLETARDVSGKSELLLPDLESSFEELNSLAIISYGKESGVNLRKDIDRWVVIQRENYPADFKKISRLIRDLGSLEILELKTDRIENHARLGVAEGSSSTAKLLSLGPLGQHIIVGNDSGDRGTFVRLRNNPQVYLTNKTLDLEDRPGAWIDPIIINIEPEKIQSIKIENAERPALLVNRGEETGDLVLDDVPVGRELRYETIVDGLGRMFVNLRLDDVKPYSEGFIKQGTRISVLLITGEEIIMQIQSIDGQYWLRVPEDRDKGHWLFEISETSYQDLNRTREDLLRPLEEVQASD